MELSTITELTRHYHISTRTLRYYEQAGLIQSTRQEGYAYRMYDEKNAARVGQIVLLRRLRIPLKHIGDMLASGEVRHAIEVFQQQANELDGEIEALDTLRRVLLELIGRLEAARQMPLSQKLLEDQAIRALIRTVAEPSSARKELPTMNEMTKAQAELGKVKNVRIIFLPPATVAASHFIGPDPEDMAGKPLLDFAKAIDITTLKPDVRMYGFNHPNPVDESDLHGYEYWLTIPEDMPVPAPLQKKQFKGGLYAAHMIKFGDFQEWGWLERWVQESEQYEYCGSGTPEDMFGSLEEHLNVYSRLKAGQIFDPDMQLDLLIPVRPKNQA